jgi:hypothetical protein
MDARGFQISWAIAALPDGGHLFLLAYLPFQEANLGEVLQTPRSPPYSVVEHDGWGTEYRTHVPPIPAFGQTSDFVV